MNLDSIEELTNDNIAELYDDILVAYNLEVKYYLYCIEYGGNGYFYHLRENSAQDCTWYYHQSGITFYERMNYMWSEARDFCRNQSSTYCNWIVD